MLTKIILGLGLVLVLSMGWAHAQAAAPDKPSETHTGKLQGRVTDASGKKVPGAGITLTDIVTHQATSTKSDSKGKYELAELFPGDYTVKAEKEGMKSEAVDLKVRNGKTTTVDLTLKSQ